MPDHITRTSLLQRVHTWRLLPLIYLALGAVILIAQLAAGNATSGLGWFAVMALVAAVFAFGGRADVIRQARGDFVDERDANVQQQAQAATGTTLVIVLTGYMVFELARGGDASPYSLPLLAGGATYFGILLLHRFRD